MLCQKSFAGVPTIRTPNEITMSETHREISFQKKPRKMATLTEKLNIRLFVLIELNEEAHRLDRNQKKKREAYGKHIEVRDRLSA